VELAEASAPLVQSRNSTHTWTFERALDAADGSDPADAEAVAEATGQAAAAAKAKAEKDALAARRSASVKALGATYAAAVREQGQAARDARELLLGTTPLKPKAKAAAGAKVSATTPSFEAVAVAVEKPMGLTLAEEIEERGETEDDLEEDKIDKEVEKYLADTAKEIEEYVYRPAGNRSSRSIRRRVSLAVVHAVAAGSHAEGCARVGDRLVSVDGKGVQIPQRLLTTDTVTASHALFPECSFLEAPVLFVYWFLLSNSRNAPTRIPRPLTHLHFFFFSFTAAAALRRGRGELRGSHGRAP
jgi:hypothetical protein